MKITDVPVGAMWRHDGYDSIYVKLDQSGVLVKRLKEVCTDSCFSLSLANFHIASTTNDAGNIVLVTEA